MALYPYFMTYYRDSVAEYRHFSGGCRSFVANFWILWTIVGILWPIDCDFITDYWIFSQLSDFISDFREFVTDCRDLLANYRKFMVDRGIFGWFWYFVTDFRNFWPIAEFCVGFSDILGKLSGFMAQYRDLCSIIGIAPLSAVFTEIRAFEHRD